jgi:hypothetical protein
MDSCAFFYTKDYVVKFIGGVYADKRICNRKCRQGTTKVLFQCVDAFEAELQSEPVIFNKLL